MNIKKDRIEQLVEKFLKVCHIKLSDKFKHLFVQLFKFGIVGGIAFLIDFVLLFLFKEWFKLPVLVANTLSFIISTIYNYIASVSWVFDVGQKNNKRRQFIVFLIFSVMGLLLNDLIMWLLVHLIDFYYLVAKIIATIIVMIFNFVTRKRFLE